MTHLHQTALLLFALFPFGISIAQTQIKSTDIKFEQRVADALRYSKANKMNTSYCILVDMSLPSGKNRLFVYDFKKEKIIIEGLCAHGSGGGSTPFKTFFSNKVNSNCTSLGKYKLGQRSYSKWGIHVHYKMLGLDSSNRT
jgi:hypothetical protein